MSSHKNRRRFLATLGTGAFILAAGCTEQLSTDASYEESDEDDRPALEWPTDSDWVDVQERNGVVSTNDGEEGDTFVLGYDPTAEPVSDFDAFWPLDENDPDTDTFADAIGDTDLTHNLNQGEFTDDIDPSAPGLFGGTSVEFGGEDALLGELPVDPSEDWTIGLWVSLDSPEDWACAMMMEALDDVHEPSDDPDDEGEALGLLPTNDPPAFKIGSVSRTGGRGSAVDSGEWHFYVVRYEAAHNLAEGYLDGELDYPIQPEDGEEWIPDLQNLTLGLRRAGSNDYAFNGRLDLAFATQGLVPEEDIQQLYEAASKGRVVTPPQSSEREAVGLKVTAEVPVETAVAVTVHQDTTGNGESDISQTITLSDDTESYGLDEFEATTDGTYWVAIDLQTSDPEVTPRIGPVAVELGAVDD